MGERIELGSTVKDKISEVEGVAAQSHEVLGGHSRIGILRAAMEGKPYPQILWAEAKNVEVIAPPKSK